TVYDKTSSETGTQSHSDQMAVTASVHQSKIDEVKRKIQNSNTVKKLFEESRIRRGVLTGKDYVIAMNSITYFMFSKKETIILGALIALRLWNETINSFYYLASEDRLAQITYKIFRNAGIDIQTDVDYD
ncbi:hypothetical protein PN652_18100, partial [Odoribacter splanchnicus]|uniref:hypothetical protein n=1 Tax=Odoribacter splanchnicus TaxID=28118 RepID=UPI00232FAF6C